MGSYVCLGNYKSRGSIGESLQEAEEDSVFLKMQLCCMNLLIKCVENQSILT